MASRCMLFVLTLWPRTRIARMAAAVARGYRRALPFPFASNLFRLTNAEIAAGFISSNETAFVDDASHARYCLSNMLGRCASGEES